MNQKRIEAIAFYGHSDQEKYEMAQMIIKLQGDLNAERRAANEEIREAARDARDAAAEAYWQGRQGEDYGSW